MADEDDASKTEEPTDRKLGKAREKGQVSQSQEVKNWAALLGISLGMLMLIPGVMRGVAGVTRRFIESPEDIQFNFEQIRLIIANLGLEIAIILGPLIGLMVLLALANSLAQVGLIWSTEKLKPDFSKLNLFKGAKKLFSPNSLVEFAKSIVKLIVVSAVGLGAVMPSLSDITTFPTMDIIISLDRLYRVALILITATFAVMTVVAVLDWFWQKYSFTKSMRMTKQEIKDEQKSTDGDPQIKARIRKIRVERFQQRMMASVPEADVVITNPTHFAVALKYKMDDMTAPKVVAKGVDFLAHKIKSVAEENDVTIVENPLLARALYAAVEVDEEIPAEHYKAVAEIIGYVMRLRGDLPPDPEADRAALAPSVN